jgi:putative ABC transport system permease protein
VSALNRKLLRDLKAAAGMLLAITGIITVGVTCFVGLSSSYHNLADAKRRYYAECRMADFSIEVKKVPLSELGPVAGLPGVAEIRPRIQSNAAVDLEGVEEPLNGLVLSLPDRKQPTINDVLVRRGSYFTDRRENEVLVSESFAKAHRISPGQWIHLLMNNRRQELFVVGTAISSEFVYMLGPGTITPDPKHFGVFYLKQSFAEDVFDFSGAANQILGRLDGSARANCREVLRRAENVLASYGVFTTTPLEDQFSNRFLSQEIQGLWSFAFITPTMFLAVAAVVLNVFLTRLTQQQRTVIGTFKALGYSDAELFWHLQRLGIVVGLLGGLLGCAMGFWLSHGMSSMYRLFFQFSEFDNQFWLGTHVLGLGISVGCAVLGSLRGSRAVLRLRPAEAMRPAAPRQGGSVWLERFDRFWKSLGSGWRMVLRNTLRNRVRTIAGLFAAAMGASVLVNAWMMADSMIYFLDFQFRHLLRSDMDLSLKDERSDEALLEAAKLPGVDRAEPFLSVACTFRKGAREKKASITGLAPGARLTVPRDRDARPIRIPQAGLAMSRTLAEILDVKPGDTVTIEPIKGLRRAREVPVCEIADSYFGLTVYADIHYLSRLVGEESALSGVQLSLDNNRVHLAALHRELKRLPALEGVAARADVVAGIEETVLKHQWVVIDVMILFAGIVFFGSIVNASLVSLAERQREVATLRVLGYGNWQIGSLLLRESMMVTVLGTVLGMPMGYLLTVTTVWSYNSEMFRVPIITRPGTWGWTLILAVLFGLIAHLFVQRSIGRMAWLDALKAQE